MYTSTNRPQVIIPIGALTFNIYCVEYYFNHSKMGFSNSISVESFSKEDAINKAIDEVSGCYGKNMLNRFSFKDAIIKK